jgi:hypothetical protein
MNHQRHVIREAIVALLAAAGTTAGSRVYDTPWDVRTAFPALTVEDDSEGQQVDDSFFNPLAQSKRLVQRTLHIIVTAEVQQLANYARARDQLLAEVESALANSAIAGVKSITPQGFKADLNYVGERPIAVGRQFFDVVYTTPQGAPNVSN